MSSVSTEPELFNGYDPKRKGFTQEVEIQHDLEPIEASEEDAARFKREHGDLVDVYTEDGSRYFVKFKKGAKLNIPKAVMFDRVVAGQSESPFHPRLNEHEHELTKLFRSPHWLVAQGFRHPGRHRVAGRSHGALGPRVRCGGSHDGRCHRPVRALQIRPPE